MTAYSDVRVVVIEHLDTYMRVRSIPDVYCKTYQVAVKAEHIATLFDSFEKKTGVTRYLYVFFSSAKVLHLW